MKDDATSVGFVPDTDLAGFCDREHARIVRIVTGVVGDRQIAEDLAQETFVRVHLHWDRVRRTENPQAWTTRVATNLANSWWRRRYAEARANRRHGEGPTATVAVESADKIVVRRAVAALPRRQRTVISLRYFGGLSVSETAAAMGCRPGTVKSLTHKAMALLRVELDEDAVETAIAIEPVPVPGLATTEEA